MGSFHHSWLGHLGRGHPLWPGVSCQMAVLAQLASAAPVSHSPAPRPSPGAGDPWDSFPITQLNPLTREHCSKSQCRV